jgi:predicted transcriptional regulator
MATRDKYNFTQQTDLWGPINYVDVPSYSATSVGTTGNAYLIRNFLKQFFPFLDLSVKKTAGGSVNVGIQNFTVKFNFTEGGVLKEFILNSKSLEDILEPLFEGQGFDGMTDSTYSKPLPPMYNKEGQDVSYGYNYLFVRNENIEGNYLVNLDNKLFANKYSFDVAPNSNLNPKTNLIPIEKKTVDYIKLNAVPSTTSVLPQGIYPTPYDSVSEVGTIPNLTKEQLKVLNALSLNEGTAIGVGDLAVITDYPEDLVINVVNGLEVFELIDVVNNSNQVQKRTYAISKLGKEYLDKKNSQDEKANVATPINPNNKLTPLEQEIIDFLAENNSGVEWITILNFFLPNKNYVDSDVSRAMSDLLQKDLVDNNQVSNVGLLYYVTTKGKSYITPKQPSLLNQNDPKQILVDSGNKSTLTSGDVAAIEFITQNYTILKDMEKESPELYNGISEGLRLIMSLTKGGTGQLEPFKPLENQQQIEDQLKEDDFDLSEVDLEELDLTGLEDDLELNDDELGDFDLTEFNELSDFVESELMPSASQDDRDYAILKTVQLQELSNKPISTKQILESVNFNNEQKYTSKEIDILEGKDLLFRSNGIYVSTKGEKFIDEYELKNKQVETVLPPVDIANLNALEKDILRILDEPPAKGKSTLYNEMDSFEIFAKVTDGILPTSDIVKLNEALGALIELKLILSSGTFPETFRLMDNPRTAEIVKQIKNESVENAPEILLLPSQRNVLKVLYDYYKKFPVANEMNSDSIRVVLEQDNIIYGNNQILKYLEELSDFEFVVQDNDFKGNISWMITPEGVDFFEKLPKTGGQVRAEQKQEKIEKDFGSLDYDFYLVAKILNENMGMLTAGTVTTVLQQQFNKQPKWDEFDILSKLRGLLSMGLALEDTENSTEYFEISAYGEDVVNYLIEKESKGLYPKTKPTQPTVAVRPSPTESATLNPIGTIKEGNDGNNWQVRANKSGVKRWVKLK